MKHMNFNTLRVKALTNADVPGTFEAITAVFGNVDRAREVIPLGAFEDSLKAGLPSVVWSHDWMTPPVGVTLGMEELDRAAVERLTDKELPPEVTGGLYGKGRLFVNTDDGEDVPLARHVYTAMKSESGDGRPALNQFSIGLNVIRESFEERDGMNVVNLEKCDLIEWGPCLRGINPETFQVGTKADDIRRAITEGIVDPGELRKALEAEDESDDDSPTVPWAEKSFTPEQRQAMAAVLFA